VDLWLKLIIFVAIAAAAFVINFAASFAATRQRILTCLLAADRPLQGLEMVNRGVSKRGSIYVVLSRMQRLVFRHESPDVDGKRGGLPKFTYELTLRGRLAAQALEQK
jgi:hypothetical protein